MSRPKAEHRGATRTEPSGTEQVSKHVTRVQRAGVNLYLIHSGDGITMVDAGLPGMWRELSCALQSIGAIPRDIRAILLTHGHFDHVGVAARLHEEHGVPIYVHPGDRALARHPYRYDHEAPRWSYPFRYPASLPLQARMLASGALWVKGVEAKGDLRPGVAVDVPGRPVPVASPGHTYGHCGLFLPDDGIIFSGDALVTLDPYTGRTGPRMVARAATADVAMNLVALANLAETDAELVLPGHGRPHAGGIRQAVDAARGQSVP